MAAKSSFCFSSIPIPRGIGSSWNPVNIDAQTLLYLPRCHLLCFTQQIGRYVVTTTKGKVRLYIKIDKILHGKKLTGSIFWAHLILWEIAFGKAVIWLDGCKKLFLFFFNTNTSRHRIKLEPRYVEAQGPIPSFKVPFFIHKQPPFKAHVCERTKF